LYQKLQKDLHKVQGTSIKGITKEEVLCKNISLPFSISEQQRIGQFFSSLDRLLTLHQQELSKLQNIKKALLEKMFV
jgi:type I restriction enzyme S subunit